MSTACDIVHVDLDDDLTRLDGPEGGTQTVLCWRGIPLGQVELPTSERLSESEFAAAALEALSPELDAQFGAMVRDTSKRERSQLTTSDPRRLLRAAMSLLAAFRQPPKGREE